MADYKFNSLLDLTSYQDKYVQDLYCGEGSGWVEDYGLHYGTDRLLAVKLSESRVLVSWIIHKTESFGLFASDGSWPIPDYDSLRAGVAFALVDCGGASPRLVDKLIVDFPEPLSPVWYNANGNGFVGPDGDVYVWHAQFIGYTIYPGDPDGYWTEGPLTSSLDSGYPFSDPSESTYQGRRECAINVFSRIKVTGDTLSNVWTTFNGDPRDPSSLGSKYVYAWQNHGSGGGIFWWEDHNCVGFIGGQILAKVSASTGKFTSWDYGYWGSTWGEYYTGQIIFLDSNTFFGLTSDSSGTGYIYGNVNSGGLSRNTTPVANQFTYGGKTYVINNYFRESQPPTLIDSSTALFFMAEKNVYTGKQYVGKFTFTSSGVPTLVSVWPWDYQTNTSRESSNDDTFAFPNGDGVAIVTNMKSTSVSTTKGGLSLSLMSQKEYYYMDWTPQSYSPTSDHTVARCTWMVAGSGVYDMWDDFNGIALPMSGGKKYFVAWSSYSGGGAYGDDDPSGYPNNRMQGGSIWCANIGGSAPPPLKLSQRDDDKVAGGQRIAYTPQNGDSQRIGWQAY